MKLSLSALLVAALLALAACGDDNDDESAGTTGGTPTTEEGVTGATGEDGETGDGEPCPDADSPPNITAVTSYGADCAAVEDAMADIGPITESFQLGDFACEQTSGSELAGTWECRGEATYFTFEFGD